ncbi:MAG: phospho-N-acetylmuramoyl-pentapeptide-transferase [Clostridiales bacterium]|nr:phospho-N-acetylmuramoyl-pentapeptide-transferase [Clostridiales bacterium]
MYRMIGALLLGLGIALATGPKLIAYLKKLHFGQTIYELGPAHQQKQGTPVMGGLMIAAGVLVASLIFHPAEWNGGWDFIFPLLGVAFLSMGVGFADDYIKAVKKRHDGLSPWQKIGGQVIVAVGFSVYCYLNPAIGSKIWVPFLNADWDLGIFYIPVMSLLTIFIVNSSNLQDGLDGLLGTVTALSSSAWAVICVMILTIPALAGAADKNGAAVTAVFALAMAGACVGYLRYNRYPAKTFMGDTGSMLIGGGTIAMAMVLRLPLLLILIFFTPIMSSVSVMMQVGYFKLTHGKRIFLMSPIHHHFEKKGYSETQIVSMYAGITLVLSLIAILSLTSI